MNTLLLASTIHWDTLAIVLGIFVAVALLFCILILVVTKICKVDEDQKVAAILERLGGSYCGGCGCSGCAAFAQKLANGQGNVSDCHATTPKNSKEIAAILGVQLEEQEPTVSVVHCTGGIYASDKFLFAGYMNCDTLANSFQGGQKACPYGCLGGGECKLRCPHGAISIHDGVAYIDKTRCTSCGACLNVCPKKIISRIPRRAAVYIGCSSQCRGKEVTSVCQKGCIGCGLCAKSCPAQAITMTNNFPTIDYSKCTGCKTCMAKCPRKIIHEA